MESDFTPLLAARTQTMSGSAIREILKLLGRPGIVSLAGGIPAPDTFPMDVLEHLFSRVLERWGSGAFQYDLTEGFIPLREASAPYLRRFAVEAETEHILVTSGSQGLLDAVGKILIGPGDAVAVESPTYLGALQAFNPYGPRYIEIETDTEGAVPDSLEHLLLKDKPKFIYLVPTFQNPTGRTLSMVRRRAIADIITRHGALLVEDDPYAALRYRGEVLPSIKSLAPENVIYGTTFSKVFAPGLRLGLAVPPKGLLADWLVKAKQGTDLHSNTLGQALAAVYLEEGHLERQIPKIVGHYAPRLDAMLMALDRSFPADWHWNRPEGGMFLWAVGPAGTDTLEIYHQALERNVAFVPGRYFYADPARGEAAMRLNFTNADPDSLLKAVSTLGEIVSVQI
ncbi:MAG: PLP-dependent aminotransferase family protein [Spirochaetaceae bacterium]|nr:PLP-dependent aminotransferase family protein [Spirochaetaceae bacterium]